MLHSQPGIWIWTFFWKCLGSGSVQINYGPDPGSSKTYGPYGFGSGSGSGSRGKMFRTSPNSGRMTIALPLFVFPFSLCRHLVCVISCSLFYVVGTNNLDLEFCRLHWCTTVYVSYWRCRRAWISSSVLVAGRLTSYTFLALEPVACIGYGTVSCSASCFETVR